MYIDTKPQALFYWVGKRQPKWRRKNIEIFRQLHPEFDVSDITSREVCGSPYDLTDKMRTEFCSGGPYRLWMDSDIELHSRLPLGDLPALGYERFPHHTICWSGAYPEYFQGSLGAIFARFKRGIYTGSGMYIHDTIYTHWLTGKKGEKLPRNKEKKD